MYIYKKNAVIKLNIFGLNRKKILLGLITCMLVVIISLYLFTKTVNAQDANDRIKIVASVEVERGDTLWSIAEKFKTDEYSDINEYIMEIKASNGLTTDDIHTGHYLIVPYYVDANSPY